MLCHSKDNIHKELFSLASARIMLSIKTPLACYSLFCSFPSGSYVTLFHYFSPCPCRASSALLSTPQHSLALPIPPYSSLSLPGPPHALLVPCALVCPLPVPFLVPPGYSRRSALVHQQGLSLCSFFVFVCFSLYAFRSL